MKDLSAVSKGKIEVAGYEYDYQYVHDLKNEDGDNLYGEFSSKDFVIRIKSNSPKARQRITLYHELVHAALEHAGLGNIEHQEVIADAISYGLCSVKINGKKLLR